MHKIHLYHITCWEPFKTCWQLGIRKSSAGFSRYFCLWPLFPQCRGITHSFFPTHKCHSSPHAPTLPFLVLRENHSKHNFIYQNTLPLCILTMPEQTEQSQKLTFCSNAVISCSDFASLNLRSLICLLASPKRIADLSEMSEQVWTVPNKSVVKFPYIRDLGGAAGEQFSQ